MPTNDSLARALLIEQRRRLVASILDEAERTFRPKVTTSAWQSFRTKVLDSIGTYHDLSLDILKVTEQDTVRNEESLALLMQVRESQRRIERSMSDDR